MVTNTVTVAHDAYAVETVQMVHTTIKLNKKQEREFRTP